MVERGELQALRLGDGPNRQLRVFELSLRVFLQQRLRK
jgi:hypothetical protein